MSYTKLFSSIVTSTIWTEDAVTCKVWVTMLAIANKHGEVQASIPGLARVAGVTLEETESALAKFLSPDKYSRTPDDEGRRIEPLDGGWLLLNHAKYRAMASKDEEITANAKRQAAFRERAKRNAKVTASNETVTVNRDIAEAEAEAEVEAESESEALLSPTLPQTANPSGFGGDEKEITFLRFWTAYPKRKGKADALKAWKKKKLDAKIEIILEAIRRLKTDDQWTKDGGRFIPHPARWINSGGWEDETFFSQKKETQSDADTFDWHKPIVPPICNELSELEDDRELGEF